MNRTERISTLLLELKAATSVKASELAGRFGVSLQTVRRDIKALEEKGFTVIRTADGYTLPDEQKQPTVRLTPEELDALETVRELVSTYGDYNLGMHYSTALYKVRSVLRTDEQLRRNDLTLTLEAVGAPVEPDKWLSVLNKAVEERQVVHLHYYSPANDELTGRLIEPWTLYTENGTHYLEAYCRLRQEDRVFRLDRIQRILLPGMTFEPDDSKRLGEGRRQV